MKYFIFRNTTLEPFFNTGECLFSGYEDISFIDSNSDTYIWFYIIPFQSDLNKLAEQINFYFNNLQWVYQKIPAHKSIFVFTLTELYDLKIQTGDFSIQKAINEYNAGIIKFAEERKNVRILNISNFTKNYSINQLIDWKYYFISRMLLNPRLSSDFKQWFQHQMNAIEMKRKKCIVLDLDNTLWGGILGEDGIDGIKIGGSYPGNSFLEFQKSLLELQKAGVILAVCSKNNESDVVEVWEQHPDLVIKKEHLSAYKINWNNKAENIKQLAEELNIGLDSIVFIDDNASERELVKQVLPMVEVAEFPSQPYHLPVFFQKLTFDFFQIYKITDEDKLKTEQYKSNFERVNFQKEFSNYTEYLASLEIQIQVQKANSFLIPRIAQLTQKTNQFNFTTKRYTEGDILQIVENGDHIFCINVKDKFGDSGITGLIIIELDKSNNCAQINSFLLSCRILGKNIEEAFLFFILNKLKSEGINKVYASYLPTIKNVQVKDFYEKEGFIILSENIPVSGAKNYIIDITNKKLEIASYFKIEEQ
jgi:FkbH-like protein